MHLIGPSARDQCDVTHLTELRTRIYGRDFKLLNRFWRWLNVGERLIKPHIRAGNAVNRVLHLCREATRQRNLVRAATARAWDGGECDVRVGSGGTKIERKLVEFRLIQGMADTAVFRIDPDWRLLDGQRLPQRWDTQRQHNAHDSPRLERHLDGGARNKFHGARRQPVRTGLQIRDLKSSVRPVPASVFMPVSISTAVTTAEEGAPVGSCDYADDDAEGGLRERAARQDQEKRQRASEIAEHAMH